MLFDSHAHYNDEKFIEDRDNLIQEIYNSGVTKIINAGYNVEASKTAIQIAKKYDFIYATAGISPNDIPNSEEELKNQLEELEEELKNKIENKIVAVGEIGLDYYWNKENKDLQKQAFIKQIELANKYELPIVIHTREAVQDTIDILKNEIAVIKKGVFHCCPLNQELIKEALKLGFYISFAGPITFKNSKNANEVIKIVPLEKTLIETDSPYLSPEPNRGKRNDSRNVKYIAEKIAQVKEIPFEEIAKTTYNNASELFLSRLGTGPQLDNLSN